MPKKVVRNEEVNQIDFSIIKKIKISDNWPFLTTTLFVTFLLMLSLVCFCKTYSYPLSGGNIFGFEVIIILIYFFIFSSIYVGILFPLGWFISKRVFKYFGAIAIYFFVLSILDVNLIYSPGEIVSYYVSDYLGSGLTEKISRYGSNVIALLCSSGFLWLFKHFKDHVMEVSTMFLMGICAVMIISLYGEGKPRVFEKEDVKNSNSGETQDRNLIYLIFNNHGSHSYLLENKNKYNKDSEDYRLNLMNGFYQKFDFTFYPHSYSVSNNNIFSIVSALNFDAYAVDEKIHKNYLQYINDISYSSYVKSGEDDKPVFTMTQNSLFKMMYDYDYKINVYQTKFLDFCKGVGSNFVYKCITFPTYPSTLYNQKASSHIKALTTIGHWFYAHKSADGIVSSIKNLLWKIGISSKKIVFLGMPLNDSYSGSQINMLDTLQEDILEAKGKNVFFAYIMLPSEPYIFDQYCNVKPHLYDWHTYFAGTDVQQRFGQRASFEDKKDVFNEYMNQLSCVYGKLDGFFDALKKQHILEKSIVIMHGDSGAKISQGDLEDKDYYKDGFSTFFAIYEPNKKTYEVRPEGCDVTTLVSSFFLRNSNFVCADTFVDSDSKVWGIEYPYQFDFYGGQTQYQTFINQFKSNYKASKKSKKEKDKVKEKEEAKSDSIFRLPPEEKSKKTEIQKDAENIDDINKKAAVDNEIQELENIKNKPKDKTLIDSSGLEGRDYDLSQAVLVGVITQEVVEENGNEDINSENLGEQTLEVNDRTKTETLEEVPSDIKNTETDTAEVYNHNPDSSNGAVEVLEEGDSDNKTSSLDEQVSSDEEAMVPKQQILNSQDLDDSLSNETLDNADDFYVDATEENSDAGFDIEEDVVDENDFSDDVSIDANDDDSFPKLNQEEEPSFEDQDIKD
ncbi:MAG: hypothetical protein AB7U85_04295 [Alphaproteobacteria bacterium]